MLLLSKRRAIVRMNNVNNNSISFKNKIKIMKRSRAPRGSQRTEQLIDYHIFNSSWYSCSREIYQKYGIHKN